MEIKSVDEKLYEDIPVCQVNCVDEDKVNQIKGKVNNLNGFGDIFKVLADNTRIKVIYALSETELCVCDVAALIGGSTATASYHLRLLHHMGLAKYRKEGKLVYYRLTDSQIGNIIKKLLKDLIEISVA